MGALRPSGRVHRWRRKGQGTFARAGVRREGADVALVDLVGTSLPTSDHSLPTPEDLEATRKDVEATGRAQCFVEWRMISHGKRLEA